MYTPTLCLNMIVKNESKIILRLLESVYELIDSYVICDTGSTDNTIEVITNFFIEKGIKGKIVQEAFQDFGYNRTFALNACIDMDNADYVLLLDADMTVTRNLEISVDDFKRNLIGGDVYLVFQGNPIFNYKNTRIVKNRIGAIYWGVTHEYVKISGETHNIAKEMFYIHDIGDGGCKDDKTARDIRLLEKGLIDYPDNDRYTFYLANSYRDIKHHDKAIDLYKKRIEIGGWIEEIWYSHYVLGKLYQEQANMEIAIYHWLEAYNVFPNRIENIYHIVKHYREHGNNQLAYNFYCIADYERGKSTRHDFLFTESDIYDYKLDYELTIIGYYSNDYYGSKYDMQNICMKVLANQKFEELSCRNILSNYKFYTAAILETAIPLPECNSNILSSIGKNQDFFKTHFNSTTPSICFGKNMHELLVCVRFVNYYISEKGDYINDSKIITKNVMASIDISSSKWIKTNETILEYNSSIDDYYVGQEDVRIHRFESIDKKITHNYTCNRCNQENKIKVEHGSIKFSEEKITTINSNILSKDGENDCEKNWCLFDNNGKEKCIYGWSPLIIGEISGRSFIETHRCSVIPEFFKYLRGSSNGIIVGDEIWFICHLVSYEDRRYYYHIIVVLDKDTFAIKTFTKLFTFEKQKVEYSLGFVYFKSQQKFLIGYSILDKESKYCFISKHIFDNMMIRC